MLCHKNTLSTQSMRRSGASSILTIDQQKKMKMSMRVIVLIGQLLMVYNNRYTCKQYYQIQHKYMDTIPQYQYHYTQNQTNICNSDAAQNRHQWCTFQAVDLSTFIVEIIYLLAVIAVCTIASKNYKKVRRLERNARYRHMFGDAYFWMHQIIFGWLGSTLVRLILNIIVYLFYMRKKDQPSDDSDPSKFSLIVIIAVAYELIDFGCAFLINLLLILMVFQFIKNLIISVSQTSIITFGIKRILAIYLKFLNLVRLYCKYFRNVLFLVVAIPQIILFFIPSLQNKCSLFLKINYYLISGETILIIIFYASVGTILVYLYCNQMLKIQSKDFNRLSFYSTLFIICLFVRLSLNFIFTQLIFKQNYYQPDHYCANIKDGENSIKLTVVLVFHHLIMHLFPICLILYIYRPTLSKYEMESLLDNKSDSSFIEEDISYKSISVNFYKDSITEVPRLEQNKPNEPIHYT